MTLRASLQQTEMRKLQSRLKRLPDQLKSPDVDPKVVGWLNLSDGIWLIALMQEDAEARPFFQAALQQLERHQRKCDHSSSDVEHLYNCFSSSVGIFFCKSLLASADIGEKDLSKAFEVLKLAFALSPPESQMANQEEVNNQTPLLLFVSSLLALRALRNEESDSELFATCKKAPVKRQFVALKQRLLSVVTNPTDSVCDEVAVPYRAAIRLEDYRLGLVAKMQLQHILAISTVAQRGDVLRGAVEMFA